MKAQSILAADGVKRQLKVVAEGTPMHFNIPLILKAGQPIEHVQIDLPKTFVADSQKVQITAIGKTIYYVLGVRNIGYFVKILNVRFCMINCISGKIIANYI